MTGPGEGGIIEQSGDAVVVLLPGGVIMSWNDAAEALYGYTAADVIGMRMRDLTPPDRSAALAELYARAAAGERVARQPVVRRHRDGHHLDLVVDVFPVPASTVEGIEPRFVPTTVPAGEWHRILRHLDAIVFLTDAEGNVTFSAGGGAERMGVDSEAMLGVNLRLFADNESSRQLVEDLLSGQPIAAPLVHTDTVWSVNAEPLLDGDRVVGIAGVLDPIDQSWAGAASLAVSEARYRALAHQSSDLVAIIGTDGTVSYVSASVEKLLGWRPDQIVGRPVTDLVEGEPDEAGTPFRAFLADLSRAPAAGADEATRTFDVRLPHRDGTTRDYEIILSDYADDSAIGGFVVNGRDVTDRRRAETRLRHASLHDALTDLPNRTLLTRRVDELVTPALARDERAAVVVIGLDSFKLVNDSLGPDTGDRLLQAVGRRLRRRARATDTVSRLGGDTFAVATPGVPDDAGARAMAVRLLASIAEPFDVGGRRIAVTAGAGVALAQTGETGADVVRNADTAMYTAKKSGRGRTELFSPALRIRATRRLALEQSLGRATETGQLRAHYQPIVNLEDRSVAGVEALVRWEHPDLGLVPPNDFIPLAEETGDIVSIGAWVLETACATLVDQSRTARSESPLRLAVNLSPRQLLDPDLPGVVADVLARTGFPLGHLTMEVTESVLVDDGPYTATTLRQLREMGVKLSIDDFGTGYSSLVYLQRLDATALKIDRSFVDGLGRDGEADVIVRTVIGLANSLGLDLVGEGVETEEQRQQLLALGCPQAQGYLFSRPLPAPALARWLAAPGDLLITP